MWTFRHGTNRDKVRKNVTQRIPNETFDTKASTKRRKNLTMMEIEIVGEVRGENIEYIYDLIDYYGEKEKVTSMVCTIAYAAFIIA